VPPLPKRVCRKPSFGVVIQHASQTIGMGRIVGDGALFLHIVDIAIDPDHEDRGWEKQ
jgi:ribosomal protein S18 acetylase RimI-like enzyme